MTIKTPTTTNKGQFFNNVTVSRVARHWVFLEMRRVAFCTVMTSVLIIAVVVAAATFVAVVLAIVLHLLLCC